jgi:hypothetical protein
MCFGMTSRRAAATCFGMTSCKAAATLLLTTAALRDETFSALIFADIPRAWLSIQ